MLRPSRRITLLLACLALPLAAAAPSAPTLPGPGPEPDHTLTCTGPCVAVHELSGSPVACGFVIPAGVGFYSCMTTDSSAPPNVRETHCIALVDALSCTTTGNPGRQSPYSAVCTATAGLCRLHH